jgi:RNA polymerase sigma-70 factor (ECF subfamily)
VDDRFRSLVGGRPPAPARVSRVRGPRELLTSKVAAARKAKSAVGATSSVIELPIRESDSALVLALQAGRTEARKVLFDRYANEVERLLYRILGPDSEIRDLLQDVFLAALGSIGQLRNPEALRGWLRGIAVRKARKCILRRRRWRFISLVPSGELPEREAVLPSPEVSEALRCTYAALSRMPADERVAFALRHIDGMELTAVAEACGVSLATIKRRLKRAQRTFTTLAGQYAVLVEWLETGAAIP